MEISLVPIKKKKKSFVTIKLQLIFSPKTLELFRDFQETNHG